MYNTCDNEVLQCPYNKYHTIAKSRFQRHLVKCEKNYPPNHKIICPYDATHRLNKSDIEEHVNTCPVRMIVESSYIQSPRIDGIIESPTEYDSTSGIDCGSSWERKEEIREISRNSLSFKLKDQTNISIKEDIESLVSTIGVGRGKISDAEFLNHEFNEENTESVVSTMSVGRGRVMLRNAVHFKRFGLKGRRN